MSAIRLCGALAVLLLLAGCESPLPEPSPLPPQGAAAPTVIHYKAVLIAGTGNLPVWDHAVEAVAARLRERGSVVANRIERLSAAPDVVAQGRARRASLDNVLDAIGSMKPASGEGCFVFATSNGSTSGLKLSAVGQLLTPFDLDRALLRGCGDAPSVIVISAAILASLHNRP